MRFSITTLIAVLPLASATLIARQAEPPVCAASCLTQSLTNAGDCQLSDTACICSNQNVITGIFDCITSSCPASDVQAATDFGSQYCAAAGVTVSLPSATATETETATETATETSVSTIVTDTAAVASSVSSAAQSAASSASSAAESAAQSASSVAQSAANEASSKASSVVGQASSVVASATSAVANTSNAASPFKAPVGGVLAAALGLIVAM